MKKIFTLILFVFTFSISSFSAIIILNGLSHKFKVQNGEVHKGTIEVSNTGSTDQAVKLYQTDYTFSSDGSSNYGVPGLLPRSNAKWVEVGENMFTLKPKEKRVVNFQITVPSGDSLSGTYWSVIMLEGLLPPDTTKQMGQFNIRTVTRYAVQIITTTGIEGIRELIIENTKVEKKGDKRLIVTEIKNTGDYMFETLLICELFDEAGISKKIESPYRKKLYPNTSALFELDVTSFPAGKYNALILADCEDDEAFGLNTQFEFKDE
jgi:hypothetical protein